MPPANRHPTWQLHQISKLFNFKSKIRMSLSLKLSFKKMIWISKCYRCTWINGWTYLPAFLDTGLPRGNVPEQDSGSMWGAIPTQSHNPVKVDHTTGVYKPYSFWIVMWVLLRPTRTNQWKCFETGPTVFRLYPRRLESLTIYRCHYKGSTFFSVI